MVLVWIGIALGIILAIILIRKIIRTPSQTALKFSRYCKKCGYQTNGLKCPRCENSQPNHQKWR